jgi:hypothetical protein
LPGGAFVSSFYLPAKRQTIPLPACGLFLFLSVLIPFRGIPWRALARYRVSACSISLRVILLSTHPSPSTVENMMVGFIGLAWWF